jgi:hypothetical protein
MEFTRRGGQRGKPDCLHIKLLTSNPPPDGFAVANIAASAAFDSSFILSSLSAILRVSSRRRGEEYKK